MGRFVFLILHRVIQWPSDDLHGLLHVCVPPGGDRHLLRENLGDNLEQKPDASTGSRQGKKGE